LLDAFAKMRKATNTFACLSVRPSVPLWTNWTDCHENFLFRYLWKIYWKHYSL